MRFFLYFCSVKRKFLQILLWLGIMAFLTAIAMIGWMIASGGAQTTQSLKWLQFVQTMATFLLPPILCATLWDRDHQPLRWLGLQRGADWRLFLLAIAIMIVAIPGINLLADWNSQVKLPHSLAYLEEIFRRQEAAAAALTERFLQADNFGTLLINIGLMALLPAVAEELSFRGTLQQILSNSDSGLTGAAGLTSNRRSRSAVAIWATAILFSAIHMQFYGFVPRMLMGAMFGYLFVWTGSLWIPMLMHFTNNGLAVLAYYFTSDTEKSIADTIGAGDTWWLGVLSLVITSLGLLIFYRRTHKPGSSCGCGYPIDAEQES